MIEEGLGLFDGQDKPSIEWGWAKYQRAITYNTVLQLQENVKANENYYIGK